MVLTVDNIGPGVLMTLPARHLIAKVRLCHLGLLHRDLAWNEADFYEGVEQAIRTIYEHLAVQSIAPLDDLVNEGVMDSFKSEGTAVMRERWSAPPVLRQAKVVGLLSCQTCAGDRQEGPAVSVTVLVYFREEYTYIDEDDGPLASTRLTPWTFGRLASAGDHWKLTEIRAERWFYQRDPLDDNDSDDEGEAEPVRGQPSLVKQE